MGPSTVPWGTPDKTEVKLSCLVLVLYPGLYIEHLTMQAYVQGTSEIRNKSNVLSVLYVSQANVRSN